MADNTQAAEERVLMKGNEVLAEAAMRAGCRFFFGYPITPQTELAAYMAKKLPLIGGTFLQAESEVAAINMVYGAGAAGGRVMTSSSSPGVSLKSEGASYMAGADVPGVIVNVMRGGPGLGGIQPSQSDYFQATRALGHGDYFMPVLAPSTVQEMADLIYEAFDLADEYRTPTMILADGMIGQMMEPVTLPPARDPESLPAKPWATNGHGGKRAHNVVNSLYLSPEKLEDTNRERFERYEEIKAKHQRQELMTCDDAEIVVVAFGAASRIARTAVRDARAKGIKAGLLRPITLWPFPTKAIDQVIENGAKHFLSVELNMGQMVEDVRLAAAGRATVDFYGRTGGVLPTPEEVLEQIEHLANGEAVAPSAGGAKAAGSVLPHPIDRKSSYERGE
ncbi:MAG: 3-methyl-2-oxobutanoate dehydrogenase subunit VorB [Atopobiaceae bacterium]|nr:3-methyl-2-oxobutanoate dehydrogenase subunit VorB [Atopobiaceae bacterium]